LAEALHELRPVIDGLVSRHLRPFRRAAPVAATAPAVTLRAVPLSRGRMKTSMAIAAHHLALGELGQHPRLSPRPDLVVDLRRCDAMVDVWVVPGLTLATRTVCRDPVVASPPHFLVRTSA
jgi:hypothetical protein